MRLKMNYKTLEQVKSIKMLGLWVTQDMSWQLNTEEACRKAYSRLSLLTKLKYVGVSRVDLLDVYKLFIRSCLEYCSVVFHSMHTQQQIRMYENVQKVRQGSHSRPEISFLKLVELVVFNICFRKYQKI